MKTAVFALLLAAASPAQTGDRDADRDGLSDFQEIHKYGTDPTKADSDGDGIPDGEWEERREFAYSVRAILHVLAPYDAASMNDDYQDARVLQDRDGVLEVEVVVYPLNDVGTKIEGTRDWRAKARAMEEWLRPGIASNWDAEMAKEILAALAADGIRVGELTDKEVVERVSAWCMRRVEFEDSFTVFALDFDERGLRLLPDVEARLRADATARGRTLQEQLDRELYGKGMFRTKSRGSCTSSAIYLQTCLRAVGIPTRTVICVPVVDASDAREVDLVRTRLTNHRVRAHLATSVAKLGSSWASHTFNEVRVGGRWRRLNYDRLGQNVLDAEVLGLMVHVNTYRDHAEAKLSGWGRRTEHPSFASLFGGSNPYSCIALSDLFGAHAKLDNPRPEGEITTLTVDRVYWYHEQDDPPRVSMRLDDPQTAGHLVVHVAEGRPGASRDAILRCYFATKKEFVLRAEGRPDVPVVATRGGWIDPERGLADFYLRIEPADLPSMVAGAEYRLVPLDASADDRWVVQESVRVVRGK